MVVPCIGPGQYAFKLAFGGKTLGVMSIAENRASFPVVVHMLLQRRQPASQQTELLLLRRANTGFMDGYFSLPGGHAEPGELPLAAVSRELHEEVGVTVENAQPLVVLPYQSGRHVGYNFVFTTTQWQGGAYIAEPESADLLCWVPPAALPQPVVPWLAQVLGVQAAAGQRWYQELKYER